MKLDELVFKKALRLTFQINELEQVEHLTKTFQINQLEQVEHLVEVFDSLLEPQEKFFRQLQLGEIKALMIQNLDKQLNVYELLEELASIDNENLVGVKVLSRSILSDEKTLCKLVFLLS
ncbi:hypothetical protein [Viridibacillus arvi]|uniref:hypothetical protein n=1 Tax=Viridibacillus arvi TaxID=263475 RepID=UPI0034CDB3DD